MTHTAPGEAPPRRVRRAALIGLAIAGVAAFLFALRRPLLMTAPTCFTGHWYGCYDTENGVVLMTLAGLPVAALAVWALSRVPRADAWRKSVAEVGMVYGTLPAVLLTSMPGLSGGVSLVPLRDLPTWGPLGIAGNLVLLAAIGFFAPMRFAVLASVPRILLLGVACSALIETAQYVLHLHRVSSVDDILVNAAGAVLAGLASRHWWRRE